MMKKVVKIFSIIAILCMFSNVNAAANTLRDLKNELQALINEKNANDAQKIKLKVKLMQKIIVYQMLIMKLNKLKMI